MISEVEGPPKNVTVEQEIIDTTNMKFEDFASQRISSDDKMSNLSSFSGNQADSDPEPGTSSAAETCHSDADSKFDSNILQEVQQSAGKVIWQLMSK